MALKKVKGNFERMFDKNLTDLVRGIRNNKDNEAKYIAQCMEEIKIELKQDNIAVKANAVAKLTYLQMLGYDISWATFNIIEVMSSNKFTYKRIGYSAASQSFYSGSELIMLTTNMIRKDLNAQNQYEAGLALSGLSCFISPDLAEDLANDIMTLMSSTKPYLRMKAVLMMYKVFLNYPEALRPAFPKLKEKLEDPDPGVQSAAVNVVCELARKNPKNYLSLAPVFFKLMTTSTNNWMLIKIIKLFGALTPIEPRLGKKLIEPLTNLIHSTSAMSLLYECVNTVIAVLISISSGTPGLNTSVELCVQKLRILIEDSDQNLKYLGLLAMSRILKSHPKSVQAHKDLVLACLDDKDESIRLRALGLLYGMVSRKNLMEVVKKLMTHMERAEGTLYRDELLSRIIEICSQNNYRHVMDFEWYITVLIELTEMETGAKHGALIAAQLIDVGVRVKRVREFACHECFALIKNAAEGSPGPATMEVLYAAAFVLSEYCESQEEMSNSIRPLLKCAGASGGARACGVCIVAALKLTARLLRLRPEPKIIKETLEGLKPLLYSDDMEVQERAHNGQAILTLILNKISPTDSALADNIEQTAVLVAHDSSNDNPPPEAMDTNGDSIVDMSDGLIEEFADMFEGDLKPVNPNAQKRVPIPENLNINSWLVYAMSSEGESSEEERDSSEQTSLFPGVMPEEPKQAPPMTQEELDKLRDQRRQEQVNNPHYLKGDSPRVEDVPVAEIALEVPLQIYTKRSDKYLNMSKERSSKKKKETRKRKSKKHKYYSESSEESCVDRAEVTIGGELPEGARDYDSDVQPITDPHRALDLDLDLPLRDEEQLPKRTHHYPAPEVGKLKKSKESKKKTKSDKTKSDKKEKKSKKNKEVDLMPTNETLKESRKSKKDKKKEFDDIEGNIIDIDGSNMNNDKTEKHKTSKKDKDKELKKEKEHKKKKSSKKDQLANKTGYEEAIGISTPSKEVI